MLVDKVQSVLANWCAQNGYDITIISGGAAGADTLAERYAGNYDWPFEVYWADWSTHGRGAGPVRNSSMVRDASILIAFWDGESRGTKDVITKAINSGLETHVYTF